jgi:hypothetical protein
MSSFQINDADLVIAYDTEYTAASPFNSELKATDNQLVSMQFLGWNPRSNLEAAGIEYFAPPTSVEDAKNHKLRRVTFSGMIGRVLYAAEKAGLFPGGIPKGRKLKIVVVSHFNRADLSAFKDSKKLYRGIDLIQGCLVTIGRPVTNRVNVGPSGKQSNISVTFLDTRTIAADGAKSLAKIGEALRFNKLMVPSVIDEQGAEVPGIERMDLCAEQHPEAFEAYALRDCAVTLEWLRQVNKFAADWGVDLTPRTIASLGVNKFTAMNSGYLASFLGRKPKARSGFKEEFIDHLKDFIPIFSDSYFGGRNESYANGVWRAPEGREFVDYDFKSAYGCGQAFLRIPDWQRCRVTTDINELAQCEYMSFARVRFSHPPDCIFPVAPVDTESHNLGLLFCQEGVTTVIGPELLVMKNLGAHIEVIRGVVVPWVDPHGVRPVVKLALDVNRVRASFSKGSPFELLAKTALNGLYGKFAQSVGSLKSVPNIQKTFDTRSGQMKPLPWSQITNPAFASYISGVPRAALSELLATLSQKYPEVVILSATTDGLLCSATREEIEDCLSGPACRLLKNLRALIDPKGSDEIIEIKHRALEVLQIKTRGQVSLVPSPESKPILAKAGHKLSKDFNTSESEVAEIARLHRHRDKPEHNFIDQKRLISFRDQWKTGGDLVEVTPRIKTNFEYDHKRKWHEPKDVDGLIQFSTRPHRDLTAFLEHRRGCDLYRKTAHGGPLMRVADLSDLEAFLSKKSLHGRHSAFARRLLVGLSKGVLPGLSVASGPGRLSRDTNVLPLSEIARRLSAAGLVGVSGETLRKLRQREEYPATPAKLSKSDRDLIGRLCLCFPIPAIRAAIGDETLANELLSGFVGTVTTPENPLVECPNLHASKLQTTKNENASLQLLNSEHEVCDNFTSLISDDLSCKLTPQNNAEKSGQTNRGGVEGRPIYLLAKNLSPEELKTESRSPADPRHNSAAVADTMNDLIPHLETQLRRQGVTGRHLKLGRIAAAQDGTPIQDQPMAGLAHALALKVGIPNELAVIMIAAMISPMPITQNRTVAHGGPR